MPAELVMIHPAEPDPADMVEAFRQICPHGTVLDLRGGQIRALVDDLGRLVMTVFPSSPFERAALTADVPIDPGPALDRGYWTDVTLPLEDDGSRERTARRIAQTTKGTLHVRTGGPDV